jgi:hypothetical protein
LRDWHLLRLRTELFGPALSGWTDCPSCGERLEIEFDASAMLDECPTDAPSYTCADGRRFRLPTVGDLLSVADEADVSVAERRLFERCRLDDTGPSDDSDTLFDQVEAGLAALADERAIRLHLSCVRCGQPSTHALDPAEFLWNEIDRFAEALLDDVRRLAQAYGWTERDILAMSTARRAAYLIRVAS